MTVMLLHVNVATKISNVTAPSHLTLTHFSCTSLQAVDGTKATVPFCERLPQGLLMADLFFVFVFFLHDACLSYYSAPGGLNLAYKQPNSASSLQKDAVFERGVNEEQQLQSEGAEGGGEYEG